MMRIISWRNKMKTPIPRPRAPLSYLLSVLLVVTTLPDTGMLAQQQPSPAQGASSTGQGAPMSEQELDSLVSPIALYPDSLVAQILAASTFPDQVAVADNWL